MKNLVFGENDETGNISTKLKKRTPAEFFHDINKNPYLHVNKEECNVVLLKGNSLNINNWFLSCQSH